IGATAGIAWLLGGKDKEIEGAILNMLANLTGMVCDGAKGSCAIKLSTSASEAVISAYLALNDIIVPNNTGIIGNTVEDTINNLGMLCKDGF
ncbi:L-serine ammonia-lyase, iron-sulfur-dependent, subunit alpha, partial [Escherichia coli]|nr:L-serine ammonia-lyase, iron-sulfur-dependent, subunit alpha [Escherichia coli]